MPALDWLKQDISDLKTDMREVRRDMSKLASSADVARIEGVVSELEKRVATLEMADAIKTRTVAGVATLATSGAFGAIELLSRLLQ